MNVPQTYDMFLETEEYITAEEYLRRRASGEIDPRKTRIVPARIGTGSFGGFAVKLEVPRYRPAFDKKAACNAF